ncbi:MAG: pentapeptide repeat-containing protein [Gemmatirosa sp.]|nr:pentapeptide repeat-containing protein [Gemmatirosa sp.]
MAASRSHRLALVGLAAGASILVARRALAAQATGTFVWTDWLQNISNFGQLLQTAAFLFSAYQFWANRNERREADAAAAAQAKKDSNYQAWQVINSAQGKGGSGGRPDALRDLARNGISLAGVNLDGAWLEQADLREASLPMASFEGANLQGAQLQGATLTGANFRGAALVAASLVGASLQGADFTGARLSAADLSGADLFNAKGLRECSLSYTNIEGIRRAPQGWREWALENGAVNQATEQNEAMEKNGGFSTVWRQI